MRVSPDGRFAFAEIQNRLYILSLPQGGSEPAVVVGKGSSPGARLLSSLGGDHLAWTADGQAVTWVRGATFFRQRLDADRPEAFEAAVEVPRPAPEGTIVLRGAKAIIMNGDQIVTDADVVVQGNRIASVGPRGAARVPAGAEVVDVSGKTIIPGLVDVHAHVRDGEAWPYLTLLAYGVTTLRDPSASIQIFADGDLIEAGKMLGPRIFSTGPSMDSSFGVTDLESARSVVRRYKEFYRTTLFKQYLSGDRRVRQLLAIALREHGMNATTEGGPEGKMGLSQVLDGYSHEHNLSLQPLYQDVVQLYTRAQSFYTPTLIEGDGGPLSKHYLFSTRNVHDDAKLRRFTPHWVLDSVTKRRPLWAMEEEFAFRGIARDLAAIVRAGGRVGIGSHGELQGLGSHWDLWLIQSGGMTPKDALRVATVFGAEIIGVQRDLGSLEPGKLADLLVLDRDPLADIRNTESILYVMKNGELYEGETLDRIWPRRKKLEMKWRMDDAPVERPVGSQR